MTAWETNGDRVEDCVAVMLLSEYPHGQHRRGSGGDGGIDVFVPADTTDPTVVDVYQIKRFTQTLKSDQWKQIRKSLTTARDNVEFTIGTWYLVMPLNPAKGDEHKLQVLVDKLKVPFRCVWKGRSYLEALADKYPSVIDNVFHDGQERAARERQALYALLDLQKKADQPLQPQDLLDPNGPLKSVATRLNDADPFYRYEVRTGERLPTDIPDGLIMRRATYGNGWCIAIDLFPRFAESPLWSLPLNDLEVTLRFRLDQMDDATRDQLHQTLRGSGSVVLLPGEVEDVQLRAPAGWAEHQSTPTIRMTPIGPTPLRRRWRIADPSGHTIAEVAVVFRPQPGPESAGVTATGREADGVFAVDVANHDDHVGMTVRATAQEIVGRPVCKVAAGVAFLAAWHAPNTMITGLEAGEVLTQNPIQLQQAPLPTTLTKHLADLAVIQEHTDTPLLVPAELDEDQIDMAASIRWLLEGKRVQLDGPGEGARLVLGGSITPAEAETMSQTTEPFPVSIAAPCPLVLHNAGRTVSLPDVICKVLAAGLDGPPRPTENGMVEVRFKIADNTAPIIHIPSLTSVSPSK